MIDIAGGHGSTGVQWPVYCVLCALLPGNVSPSDHWGFWSTLLTTASDIHSLKNCILYVIIQRQITTICNKYAKEMKAIVQRAARGWSAGARYKNLGRQCGVTMVTMARNVIWPQK